MKSFALGIAGYSGGGKTTLIEKLIPVLKSRGLKVAVVKHDAHGFQMDHEGKDTYRFSAAGADRVMISSAVSGCAQIDKSPRSLEEILRGIDDMDIVIVEGYKGADILKMYVMTERNEYRKPDDIDKAEAIITDAPERFKLSGKTVFNFDDVDSIADFIYKKVDKKAVGDMEFTHFDDEGNARMVDVGMKGITKRTATAVATVLVNKETFGLIKSGGVKKGDVLTVAQIAGIIGAKKTPDLIPMCHPVIIDSADVRCRLNEEKTCVEIEATVSCSGRTGVEMEALSACSAAALTVIDMCKSVQRDIRIADIHLVHKTGGIHGEYHAK
ncbi:MAG: cyclic pyranopterin monophosphate synthase MoaC [Eubacterium sp.]|nr:cyclic pyranopterin monophosphate synthase MoaC [Eubacterium sp.]